MAARDILTLKNPMAEGIIRLLYTIALILIGLGTLFGIARGVMILTHTPMQRPAITSSATPPAATDSAAGQQQNAQQQPGTAAEATPPANARPDFRMGYRGDFRGWHRWGHYRGPFGMMPRSPWFGLVVILGALLRGLVALLIVRVMAEIGLALLGLPKRSAV